MSESRYRVTTAGIEAMASVEQSECAVCGEPTPLASLSSLGRCYGCIVAANQHDNGLAGHQVTDEELEVVEQERQAEQLDYATRFALHVEREAGYLRVKAAARAKVEAEADRDSVEELDAQYLSRSDLDSLPKSESLIEGVLPRHSYGVLRGRDQSFKSFVALDWALCLAMGKPWQGHHAEQASVLYIAGEGAYGLVDRIQAWESAWRTPVDPWALTVRKSALNLYRPGRAFDHLIEHIEYVGVYGLVIVDTLRRVSGGAEGNGSDMGAVVDSLDRIKRATGAGSVLVIAHTEKSDTDTRGYSGIEDDSDFVWHAKRDEMRVELKLAKMKDGPDGTVINLQGKPVLDSLVLEAASAAPASTVESQARVLREMHGSFRDGVFGAQLRDAVGLPKSTYYRALQELQDAGHLVNSGTKQRPFYELTESQSLPPADMSSDLHVSHESHQVPLTGQESHSPAALKGGTGTKGEEPANPTEVAATLEPIGSKVANPTEVPS